MYNEENFTRRPNFELNDGLTMYLNYAAQQNVQAYKAFYEFLSVAKPKRILEIGTGVGGFTMYIRMCCDDLELGTEILTYDIHGHYGDEVLKLHNVDVRKDNVFNGDYTEVQESIINYIQQDGTTIVLCDGGYKIGEFNLLSNYIKVNDFIMAHDYASTSEYFEEKINKKLWNWHEIEDVNIQDAVIRNNLKPYMKNIFDDAVWVCKIKELC
jgi:hypothetical protein